MKTTANSTGPWDAAPTTTPASTISGYSEDRMDNFYSSDVAFTKTVKDIQTRKGSRRAYAQQEQAGGWRTDITPDIKAFIEGQTSVFLATANAEGQPYIQHRGGPAGFLKVIDLQTIGFVDYVGNRQFITTGNLVDNPKAYLFLIDYANRRRIKIWGTAKVIEGDDRLVAELMPADNKARAEQVILFTVSAWDANCPQHIPQRFDAADVAAALAARDARIAVLEAEVAKLNAAG
ncbi:pyridoxamine 5'-phosphate oxidase family protein [Pseudosulfitobacter sp. DSM 107133]|uniref:pyridoxamine 5'-phosphate oxidase family protein n=2 Tax=Pseudosulfitobacter sp. DSM 107133 TaxID=2883100 RepID=UPI001FAB657C|nr:pyridoxamine 5'-phosphate oxidase family protein [Pseudosulfitobacter sp. DSM 107133]